MIRLSTRHARVVAIRHPLPTHDAWREVRVIFLAVNFFVVQVMLVLQRLLACVTHATVGMINFSKHLDDGFGGDRL